jgi:hypothetical protein
VLYGRYKDSKDACTREAAAGVTAGCQGIATKPARIHMHRGLCGHEWASVAEMRYRGEAYLHMISIICPHPPRLRLSCVSLANNEFDEYCEDDCGLCLELREELQLQLLEQVEDNIGAAECKQESGAVRECFEGQRIMKVLS